MHDPYGELLQPYFRDEIQRELPQMVAFLFHGDVTTTEGEKLEFVDKMLYLLER
jgi:hypothetical protein